MKFFKLSIICFSITLLYAVTLAKKEKGKKGQDRWGNMTCKGEEMPNGKALMEGKNECKKDLAPVTEDPLPEDKKERKEVQKKRSKAMNKNTCVDVCAKKKQGILSEDGTLNESGLETLIKSAFPEKAQTEMIGAFKTCYNDNFKSTTPSMDNNCESYTEFSKCTRNAFFKVCDIKRGKKGGRKGKKDGEEMEGGDETAPDGESGDQ